MSTNQTKEEEEMVGDTSEDDLRRGSESVWRSSIFVLCSLFFVAVAVAVRVVYTIDVELIRDEKKYARGEE